MVARSTDDDRARRRGEFLDASVALVREAGPFVSMEQLATACGVTKPILYRHFGDRDGLVLAMAEQFVDQLVEALLPVSPPGAPTSQILATTIDSYLELIERDTHLYRFLSSQAGADRRDLLASLVAEQVAVVLEAELASTADEPRAAENDDDIAGDPRARAWAYGLVGMVHFAGDWWVDHRDLTRAELVEHLMQLGWYGLSSTELGHPAAKEQP